MTEITNKKMPLHIKEQLTGFVIWCLRFVISECGRKRSSGAARSGRLKNVGVAGPHLPIYTSAHVRLFFIPSGVSSRILSGLHRF